MKKGFNLLKAQAEPPSVWSKMYDWVLGSARIIIIVVEIAVLVAFVFRIIVDLKSKELNKNIEQAESVLNVLHASELKFREIQAKTSTYKMIWDNTPDYSLLISNINSLLPTNTSIKDLTISISGVDIIISGTASKEKEDDIKTLENNLKSNSIYLTGSVLEKLQDTNSQLKFTFKAGLVNIPNKRLSDIKE